MASKKDLVEGQAFSRRRLVTAFVSGAPGGREVEPGKPLRAVVGGVILSLVLVVGAFAVGLLAPTLPDGWNDNSLVIAEDTGARYVALDGTLYPVINTTSARLLIPSDFKVVSADADKLTDTPRGPTVGIIGAPDALPSPDSLVGTGWASCTAAQGGITTVVSANPPARATSDQAVLAVADGQTFLVDNGVRYRVPADLVDGVSRVFGLTADPLQAGAAWLNLFDSGPDLTSTFTVAGAGQPVSGLPSGAVVGSVIADRESPDRRYLLLQGGKAAALTPFAYALYRLGNASRAETPVTVDAGTLGGLGQADPVWPTDWPSAAPQPLAGTACALLSSGPGRQPTVDLATSSTVTPRTGQAEAQVDAGRGAVVRAVGSADPNVGPVFLVDQTGAAFPLLGGDDPVIRLGYSTQAVVPVPQAWLNLFSIGPTLSVDAAGATVAAAAGP